MFTEYGKITTLLSHLPVPELPAGLPPLLLQHWEEEEKQKMDVSSVEGEQKDTSTDRISQEEPSPLPSKSVWAFLKQKQLDKEEEKKQKELRLRELQRKQDAQRAKDARSQANQSRFVDKTIYCRECGNEFIFTAGEQEFYQFKGLTNAPSRCPSCRAARRRVTGGTTDHAVERSPQLERGPQEMHTTICVECGCETQVPFAPRSDRPVYCSSCFDKTRVQK
jgi:CxxC-x17-CxxC domain-containing protein